MYVIINYVIDYERYGWKTLLSFASSLEWDAWLLLCQAQLSQIIKEKEYCDASLVSFLLLLLSVLLLSPCVLCAI